MKKTIAVYLIVLIVLELLIISLGQSAFPLLYTPLNLLFPIYAAGLHIIALFLFSRLSNHPSTGLSANSLVKILGYIAPLAIVLFAQSSKPVRLHFVAVVFITYIAFSILNVVFAIKASKSFLPKG